MTMLFKALGALLTYPCPELVAALPEVGAIVQDARGLSKPIKRALAELTDDLARRDLIDAQERYVELFDRGRKTSLHLFEHVHGESRDRGQAMVDLKALYARAGFRLATHELPDYLPAVLEFVSLRPEQAEDVLADCAHILRAIGEALQGRGSRYAAVLAAVLDAIGAAGLGRGAPAPAIEEKPIDQEWQEEQVVFGPGQGCVTSTSKQVSVVQFVQRRA